MRQIHYRDSGNTSIKGRKVGGNIWLSEDGLQYSDEEIKRIRTFYSVILPIFLLYYGILQ